MKIGNLEVYGVIYKITNLVNGKIYIGQTINGFNGRYEAYGKKIERVYNYHKSLKTNNRNYNRHLFDAIKKYGFENFKVIEIFDYAFSKSELDIKEKAYIRLYNSTNEDYGYNKSIGGDIFEEGHAYRTTKVYCITFNKTFDSLSEATKYYNLRPKALSRHLRGKQNRILINGINTVWCYLDDFKNMSQEDVDLLLYKSTDKYHNEQLDKNRSKRKIDDKKVICLTTGEIFDNCREATKKYNNGIYSCLKDKSKTCGKHPITGEKLRWDYFKE